MATTLNLSTNNIYARGYIIELEDDQEILKREKISYDPLANKDKVHIVRDGDRIWDIAEDRYGDGKLWYIIADANSLVNPFELETNTSLIIPSKDIIKVST